MREENIQEELVDVSGTGRKRPWREKKIKNLIVSEIYKDVNEDKAIRLENCATYVEFWIGDLEEKRLKAANFCRVRLCPMCIWRRSLKIFSQVKSIMDELQEENRYEYVLLTLTVRNCSGNDLSKEFDRLFYAWNKFSKDKVFRRTVKGWYRGLEVTHNVEKNTYHPHFHCIFAVNKSYFSGREYVTQRKWTDIWKKALGVEYTPIVNVKKVKGVTAKAVAEVAKYTVKDGDYIKPENWNLTLEIVRCLDKALDHRRLVGFGGEFRKWHKKLNLDNPVDGDLVHTKKEEIGEEEFYWGYVWDVGYQQYRLVN